MSYTPRFKFEGLKDLEMALHDLSDELGKKILNNAAMHGAELLRVAVEQEIKAKGLVESGFLSGNILKKRLKIDDPMVAVYMFGAFEDAYWDYFLEYGTYKMARRPFMLPAIEGSRGKALDKVEAVLRRRIALAVKKAARLGKRSYL